MNLQTIIHDRIIKELVIKDHIDFDHPEIQVGQTVSIDCHGCGIPVYFPLTPNLVDLDDLIKEMGKQINIFRIRDIEQLREIRALKDKLKNNDKLKKDFLTKIDLHLSGEKS